MRDWPRIGQDVHGSQSIPRFYTTSQDFFGSQDVVDSPQQKYQEPQQNLLIESAKERLNRVHSGWEMSPPHLQHQVSSQNRVLSSFPGTRPLVQTQPSMLMNHGLFTTAVDSFTRPLSQPLDDHETYYPAPTAVEDVDSAFNRRVAGKKRPRSFSEQKPSWVVKALSRLPIVGSLLSSQEVSTSEETPGSQLLEEQRQELQQRRELQQRQELQQQRQEPQFTRSFDIQNRERAETLLRRPSIVTREETVHYPVTSSFSQEKEPVAVSPSAAFSLVSTFRTKSDKRSYVPLENPTEDQYYWTSHKKELGGGLDSNKLESDKEQQQYQSLAQLLRLRQQYGLSSNIGPLSSNPAKKFCSRYNSGWDTTSKPYVRLQSTPTRQNPFIPSNHQQQEQMPLTSNYLRRKRGFRPLDYRRLLRQVKFHPCKWIDYFEYAKASEADREDRLLFPKKDINKTDLDLYQKINSAKKPLGQVLVDFQPTVIQDSRKKLRLSAEEDPMEFYDETPKVETTSIEKKRRTNKSTATPPAVPWWLVNKDKPIQVPIEDDEGIFADTAKDEEEQQKAAEAKSVNDEQKSQTSRKPSELSSSVEATPLRSSSSFLFNKNNVNDSTLSTATPSVSKEKESQRESVLKIPALESSIFSSSGSAPPLFGGLSSQKQQQQQQEQEQSRFLFAGDGVSSATPNRLSLFGGEENKKQPKHMLTVPPLATTSEIKEEKIFSEDSKKRKANTEEESHGEKRNTVLEKAPSVDESLKSSSMFSFGNRNALTTSARTNEPAVKLFTAATPQSSSPWQKTSEEQTSSRQQPFVSSSSLFGVPNNNLSTAKPVEETKSSSTTAEPSTMSLLDQSNTSTSLFQPPQPSSSSQQSPEGNTIIGTPQPQEATTHAAPLSSIVENNISKKIFSGGASQESIKSAKPSSLFGITPLGASQPSSIFGTSEQSKPVTAPSSAGLAGTQEAPTARTTSLLDSSQRSLFGTTPQQQLSSSQSEVLPATPSPSSLLFGGNRATTAASSLFPVTTSQQQTNETGAPPPAIAGFGSKEEQQPRTLFGGVLTSDTSTPKPVSIETSSQRPATSPQQSSLFGTTSFQPSLFGTSPLSTSGTSIFATPAAGTTNSSRPSSLFGGTQSSSTQQRDNIFSLSPQPLFGVKPAESTLLSQQNAPSSASLGDINTQGISQQGGGAATLLRGFSPQSQTQDSAARNPFAANTAGLSGSHSRRPFLRLKRTM